MSCGMEVVLGGRGRGGGLDDGRVDELDAGLRAGGGLCDGSGGGGRADEAALALAAWSSSSSRISTDGRRGVALGAGSPARRGAEDADGLWGTSGGEDCSPNAPIAAAPASDDSRVPSDADVGPVESVERESAGSGGATRPLACAGMVPGVRASSCGSAGDAAAITGTCRDASSSRLGRSGEVEALAADAVREVCAAASAVSDVRAGALLDVRSGESL